MRKALVILGELQDTDVDWLIGAGTWMPVKEHDVLIREGEPIDALYLILGGKFAVSVGDSGTRIATLGAGEIVGELSYLDSRPPNATVSAVEDADVMTVARSRLSSKLGSDPWFASRFYRSLGVLLAQRLRSTVADLAYGQRQTSLDDEDADELSPEVLENLSLAGARFESILSRLKRRS